MANNPYVNKVVYGNNTVMDLTEDTVTPNDVLRGVTFHDKSGASQTGNMITHNVIDNLNSDSSEDALSARMGKKVNLSSNQKVVDAVGWDGRNYFHVDDTVVSGTDNGITYTITRKNGEVTRIRCSGTPTSGDFTLWLGSWTYGGTKPILTGCPSGGGSQGTIVNYGMSAAENGGYQSVVTAGDEPAKLYEYFYSGSISVSIIIKSGYTASNLDFYPMICSEELSDYDFKAHHDSVETLLGKKQNILTFDNTPTAGSNNPVKSSGIKTAIDTSASNVQSADIDLLKDTVGWTGKNFIGYPDDAIKSKSSNGITYTVNADGSITANGTASADSYVSFIVKSLPQGNFIFNGVSGGSTSTYYIDLSVDGGSRVARATDGDAEAVVSDSSASYLLWVNVKSGQVLSNKKFYPMLRRADIVDPTYEPYHTSVKQTLRDAEVIEGKNEFNANGEYKKSAANSSATVTISSNGDSIRVVNAIAGSYGNINYTVPVKKNTDYHIYSAASVTSGYARVKVQTTGGTQVGDLSNAVTTSGEIGLTFNSGNNDSLVIVLFTTWEDSSVCDLTYGNFVLCTKDEWDKLHNFESYYIPLKDSKFDRAEQRVLGAKNLFYLGQMTTSSNTTCTISQGGQTITVENSVPGTYKQAVFTVPVKANTDYTFSSQVTGSTGYISIYDQNNTNEIAHASVSEGTVTFNTGSNTKIRIKLLCTTGTSDMREVTYTNSMLRLASDPDDTYVPYAQTNKELTDSKVSYADNGILGAKNLYSAQMSSTTIDHTTVTQLSDGVKFETDATGPSATITIGTSYFTKFFKPSFTGMVRLSFNGLSASEGIHYFYDKTLSTRAYTDSSKTTQSADLNGDISTLFYVEAGHEYNVGTKISSGVTNLNKTIYPMIRLASDPDNTYVPYAMTNKELTDSKDKWSAEATVSNGSVTFSGLDDTQGWAYEPYGWIDGNSVELNPSFTLTTISGAGTSNMTLIFSTNADSGSRAILRIIK